MAHIPGMIRVMAAVPRVHLADPQANAQEILALLRVVDEPELAIYYLLLTATADNLRLF